ncbi:hypothetical protein EZS27_020570 [termite gut metagenome]|uniref:Uncharacterized protein n=1 Tax=termite gut metagenome TaxID=433724 RepID=A0A5J4RBK8_9ZZZZ
MELKMIEGQSFDRLKQCVMGILERSKKLNFPKHKGNGWTIRMSAAYWEYLFGHSKATGIRD